MYLEHHITMLRWDEEDVQLLPHRSKGGERAQRGTSSTQHKREQAAGTDVDWIFIGPRTRSEED